MTSHAALVARQMGKVCVAGCGALKIDYKTARCASNGRKRSLKEGDWISIDGSTGEVIEGNITTRPSEVLQVLVDKTLDPKEAPVYQMYDKLMKWADKCAAQRAHQRRPARPGDNAVAFGAEGIGLCRTEHMFFGEGKIGPMREMILAEDVEGRRKALAKLLPLQREDFEGIFAPWAASRHHPHDRSAAARVPPHDEKGQKEIAAQLGISPAKVKERVDALHEFNPMLGFRGCRLGIMYPEITEMQARAIFEAAAT
jgi:pyruvate, orthophosphate dikinase